MEMTLDRLATGQSNIHLLISQLVSQSFFLQNAGFFIDFFFQKALNLVDNLADFRTFFSGQLAHATQNLGHGTLFTQIFNAQIFQRVQRVHCCQFAQRLLF